MRWIAVAMLLVALPGCLIGDYRASSDYADQLLATRGWAEVFTAYFLQAPVAFTITFAVDVLLSNPVWCWERTFGTDPGENGAEPESDDGVGDEGVP